MSAEEERTLIFAAKQGNAEAMEAILLQHNAMIAMLARRISCRTDLMEELLQAGAIGLMHAVSRFNEQRQTRLITYAVSWILGEMRTVLRDALKTGVYSKDTGISVCSLDAESGEECGGTPHEYLCGREAVNIERIDLHRAMAFLSKDEKQIVFLRYFRDQTQKETARTIGKSQAQVSRIEQRALDRLRTLLI